MLFGPDPLVEAFMDLIANNLGTVFTVEKPGNLMLLTLIPPLFLSWKGYPLFTSAAYIQVHFRLDYFMEANNINPDETAPSWAVWFGSMLFAIFRLPKNTSREE